MNKILLTAILAGVAACMLFYYEIPLGLLQTSKTLKIDIELRPHLSSNAKIHLPNSQGFEVATDRWNPWMNPAFDVVVEVATEEDVGETIKFANRLRRPFLAVSGGHGATRGFGGVKKAVGIWMRQLDDVEVLEGGKSARIGGGIKSKELVDALWKHGKQTGMNHL
jgi:FAD/FMN-containing dehydrogenase